MKASTTASVLTTLATAAAFSPLKIVSLNTNQPSGEPDGQEDFWNIGFTVNSTNGDTPQSAYCWATWSDNSQSTTCGSSCLPYSQYVPTGEWIKCAHNTSNIDDQTSEFAFQLYPYFNVGNFSVAVQQIYIESTAQTKIESDPYHITNTTGDLDCQYIGSYVNTVAHPYGFCNTPDNFTYFSVPVHTAPADETTPTVTCPGICQAAPSGATATPTPTSTPGSGCATGEDIRLSFPVIETTAWYDHVFVVGNISALGDWNPQNADVLNADSYTAQNPLWTGGDRSVPAGTAFEYKYIQWNADGTLLWECGENRVFVVPSDACGTITAGNNPDYFRCGNH